MRRCRYALLQLGLEPVFAQPLADMDGAADRLVAVVRTDGQQRIEPVLVRGHRLDDLRHQPVGDLQRMDMRGRAQRIVVR